MRNVRAAATIPSKSCALSLENRGAGAAASSTCSSTPISPWATGRERQSEQVRTWFDAESRRRFCRQRGAGVGRPRDVRGARCARCRRSRSRLRATATEFLGRHGELSAPAAVCSGRTLVGRAGEGLDPCAALQAYLRARGRRARRVLGAPRRSGQTKSRPATARAVLRRRDAVDAAATTVRAVLARNALGRADRNAVDGASNLMVNGWLPYQNLSCRMWGRSAYYQSGGAYRLPRSIAGLGGAGVPLAGADARANSATRAEPIRRRRRAALVAPARRARAFARGFPTTCCGCRWWPPNTVETTGDAALWDEPAPYLTGPAARRRRSRAILRRRSGRANRARSTSMPAARSTGRSRSARTACRSWAAAIGTTA